MEQMPSVTKDGHRAKGADRADNFVVAPPFIPDFHFVDVFLMLWMLMMGQ